MNSDALDTLVLAVQESAKYRHVCPTLIRRLGARELTTRRNLKEAIKETKNSLHQIAGAYLEGHTPYADWQRELTVLPECPHENAPLQDACLRWMQHHASTRERLPFLSTFYSTLFAAIGPVRSVLDVACGLNPLALPWMPLPPGTLYHACDLYTDQAAFLNGWLHGRGMQGGAEVRDVIADPPEYAVDVALVLKLLPLLDQWHREAGRDLLRGVRASTLVVSFPTRSLGGRGKGMAAHYTARFQTLLDTEGWYAERLEFPNEMVFIVRR